MYAYAVSKMFNVSLDNVTVAHYYPHLDKLISISYGRTQVSQFLRILENKIWEIRKKKKEEFVASQNQYCNWCNFKELCPEFGGTEQMLEEAKEREKAEKQD